jgi:hypothetical protein
MHRILLLHIGMPQVWEIGVEQDHFGGNGAMREQHTFSGFMDTSASGTAFLIAVSSLFARVLNAPHDLLQDKAQFCQNSASGASMCKFPV